MMDSSSGDSSSEVRSSSVSRRTRGGGGGSVSSCVVGRAAVAFWRVLERVAGVETVPVVPVLCVDFFGTISSAKLSALDLIVLRLLPRFLFLSTPLRGVAEEFLVPDCGFVRFRRVITWVSYGARVEKSCVLEN